MKFPYKGWFNLRGNKGKKRVDNMFNSSLLDEAIVIVILGLIGYVVWDTLNRMNAV